ncbi:hypothetical protein CEXT_639671 [Caerostris extrusa]|uniref:Uncharacterized protein n=1 Tax=Caerostris extrusa TaxID=172846 RepID=A0AAV4MDZ1_CAEEX|nr:hypothetical protein CEXT_639671 [Caerostris extrusa]
MVVMAERATGGMPAIRLQPGAGNHIATLVVLEARESMDSQPSPITVSCHSYPQTSCLFFCAQNTPYVSQQRQWPSSRILFDREVTAAIKGVLKEI